MFDACFLLFPLKISGSSLIRRLWIWCMPIKWILSCIIFFFAVSFVRVHYDYVLLKYTSEDAVLFWIFFFGRRTFMCRSSPSPSWLLCVFSPCLLSSLDLSRCDSIDLPLWTDWIQHRRVRAPQFRSFIQILIIINNISPKIDLCGRCTAIAYHQHDHHQLCASLANVRFVHLGSYSVIGHRNVLYSTELKWALQMSVSVFNFSYSFIILSVSCLVGLLAGWFFNHDVIC